MQRDQRRTEQYPRGVTVWDPVVRIGHWTIVVAFTIAYLTEDDLLSLHVWAGYVTGGAVLIRIAWGFVGPERARFSDFIYAPRAVFAYLADLIHFRAIRYLGHSPAGGAMVMALLITLAATVATGLMTYAADNHAGPLAALYAAPPSPAPSALTKGESTRAGRSEPDATSGNRESSSLREAHELFANITLVLVVLHIAGVALASIAHRENLVIAMITGRKRAAAQLDPGQGRRDRAP